jgi:hypothetical protein
MTLRTLSGRVRCAIATIFTAFGKSLKSLFAEYVATRRTKERSPWWTEPH